MGASTQLVSSGRCDVGILKMDPHCAETKLNSALGKGCV